MSDLLPRPASGPTDAARQTVEVRFGDFGWELVSDQARRAGVSVEVLVFHATMYYLADLHRGRPARVVPGQAPPGPGAPRSTRP
jgi:hypothetical protein